MPKIILKDKSRTEQTYDRKKVSFRTPTEGEKAEFIFPNFAELDITENGEYAVPEGVDGYTKVKANVPVPTLLDNFEVPLDFSTGDMHFEVNEGYAVKSAIIKQPANLVPENIAKGIVIAGIVGTHEGGGGGGETVVTWTKLEGIEGMPATGMYGVAFNNTGSRLALVGGGGKEYSELVVYDTTTTSFTRVNTGIKYVNHYGRWGVFSPDGSKLAVGLSVSAKGKVYVYDVTTTPYKEIFTTSYSSYIGYTATFSKDGTLLYVPIGGTMYVYSVSGSTITLKTQFSILYTVQKIAINPQNTRLAVTTMDSRAPIKLNVFDITNDYAQVDVLSEDIDSGSYPGAYGVTFNKAGDRLFVSVTNSPYIKILDTTTEPYSQLYNIDAWSDYSDGLAISPTGDILASARNGLYDISGSVYTKISNTPDSPNFYACAFSPDGKYIAFCGSSSPYFEVWVKTSTTV